MDQKATIEQEIRWLEEEVEQDEQVLTTSDGEAFHRERLAANRVKLGEFRDLLPNLPTESGGTI